MAEVQSRPSAPRGRGSTRGRGGFSSRGGGRSTSKSASNAPAETSLDESLDDQGELGQLKKQYKVELATLKELFPDWTSDDLVFALQETDGNLESTVERITEGTVSRFNDVKKKQREKSRSKAINDLPTNDSDQSKTSTARVGRGRGGVEGGRGGRSRGSERGRGGTRGGRGGAGPTTSGSRNAKSSTPAADSAAWDSNGAHTTPSGGWDQPSSSAWGAETTTSSGWDDTSAVPESKQASAPEQQKSSLIPEGTTKSWASMLAKPKPPPAIPKTVVPATSITDTTHQLSGEVATAPETTLQEPAGAEWEAPVANESAYAQNEATPARVDETSGESNRVTSATLPPPKDPLTEDNLEHLPDHTGPPATETVASTRDPRSTLGSAHPSFQASQQQVPISRPALGGYATTAQKAAGQTNRSLSFQKLKEQQDAVVMPGNHAIDRTAVQFGSMNLGGDAKPLDVEEEREEAETRAQPPQQSPSQPRASLPPAPRPQQAPSEPAAPDTMPMTKHAPGLPTPNQAQAVSVSQSPQALGAHNLAQSTAENQTYSQYGGRYGPSAFTQEQNAPPQKAYDPFSTQLYPQSQNDPQSVYSGISQPPGQISQPTTSQAGNYSQMHGEYGSHYPGETSRSGYSNYYSNYNQPSVSLQENLPPHRSTSGFGTGDSGFGASHANQGQSRFAEGQASGHNTPNPPLGAQQHAGGHTHQNQPMHQQSHGHSAFGGHPFGGPYGHSGYYQQYNSQGYPNYYQYNQHGYGGPYGGKGGMYGGPGHHGYGMSSHGSYDNASSPATTGGFAGSSLQGRDGSISSGLNEFPRSGSTQPPTQSQHGSTTTASGFGSMADTYGRSSSGFGGGHSQGFGAPSTSANEESIKSLHDSKTGPSPLGQAGRPGSAFNTNASGPGYGPPNNQQQGSFGSAGYPGHLGGLHSQYSGSGYGGIGGLGGHGASHGNQTGYGYGGGFGNNSYGGRGGWGGQYGNQYSH